MDEFELIRRYFVRQDSDPTVTTGIGDDGAVLRPAAGQELVSVIDTLVAGVHFPEDLSAADIGYRAVAVNLSDIAAMGAHPRWMTLALTLPEANAAWVEQFAQGLHEAADEHGVSLVGGDTTRGDQLVISVQMNGEVPPGAALHRSGAQVGDTLYVTGTLGDASAGLKLLQSGKPDSFLSQRFSRPTARVACGERMRGVASAAIDLSDGLVGDLGKLINASGVGAELHLHKLPISKQLRAQFDNDEQLRFAMSGGDDYELCFAANGDLPIVDSTPITAIGTITDGDKLVCIDEQGVVEYADSGYRHFQ